jgi:pyruvate dehydrogenase E1 component
MNATPDGQFQTYSVETGAYIRDHFFGGDPRLRKMVEHMSDEELRKLPRGGHDYRKVYAAFKAAFEHVGQPTVILAKTIKGWTIDALEGRNATHQMKKLTKDDLKKFRDRLYLPISDAQIDEADIAPFYHPGPDSPEIEYMMERRRQLGGSLPKRVVRAEPLKLPGDEMYAELKQGSGKQAIATTMALVRLLRDLMKDKEIGKRIVPIAPDEYRTFGMDGMFPTAKVYNPMGQRYESVDRNMLLAYKESVQGQMLHEGISEAGAVASATAAGSAYTTHGEHMIPFYLFYSMFGFQRTGDLMWAAGDQMTRGFLLGATAGRTTLNGEGLQHEDGHSMLLASTNPACVAYDPAFAYEVSVITRHALERMYGKDPEDVFYYLTVYNEPKPQPPMPEVAGIEDQIINGLYRYAAAPDVIGNGEAPHAQLIASGTGIHWAIDAQRLLADDWGVAADLWSATSWNELRREALDCDTHNRAHGLTTEDDDRRVPFVTRQLDGSAGPVVAVSDWMRAVPDQIAPWVPNDWSSLGTDGYGRSDTRPALRRHFSVDAESVVLATLIELARRGDVKREAPQEAIKNYGL